MGCTESSEVKGQAPSKQQQQQQQRNVNTNNNNTVKKPMGNENAKPSNANPLSNVAAASTSTVKLPPFNNDETWQERLGKFITSFSSPPSKETLLAALLQLQQDAPKYANSDVPLPSAASTEGLHEINQQMVTVAFGEAELPNRLKIFKATQTLCASAEKAQNVLWQDYIEAVAFEGILELEREGWPRAYAILTKAQQLQQAYHPGKNNRFVICFKQFIGQAQQNLEKHHPDLQMEGKQPLGWLQLNQEYFDALTQGFFDTNGEGWEEQDNNNDIKDSQVPFMLRPDCTNMQTLSGALSQVVFPFQDALSKLSPKQKDDCMQKAMDSIDVMRRVFAAAEINIDDSNSLLQDVDNIEDDGTVNPLVSGLYDTLLCMDSMMSLRGKYVPLRHHMPRITLPICKKAFGEFSGEFFQGLSSAAYSVFAGGPPHATRSVYNEMQAFISMWFNQIDFSDPSNYDRKDDIYDDRWNLMIVNSLINYIEGILLLQYKEGASTAKQDITRVNALSKFVINSPNAMKHVSVSYKFQVLSAYAVSSVILKQPGAYQLLEDFCKQYLPIVNSNFTTGLSADERKTPLSAVDKCSCILAVARALSYREHWAITVLSRDVRPPYDHQRVVIDLCNNAIRLLDDEGVAKNQNRADVINYESVRLVLADALERTGNLIQELVYNEWDAAAAAALLRDNVFAAATNIRHKAVNMRKVEQLNEQADAEIGRACDLMIDLVAKTVKNDPLLPKARLMQAIDLLETTLIFDPKWFANVVVDKCEAGAERILSITAPTPEDESSLFKNEVAALLYFAAGTALHTVGPSKRPLGWSKIKKGLQLLFGGEEGNDDMNYEELNDNEVNTMIVEKLCEVTKTDKTKLRQTVDKWVSQLQ